MRQRTGMAPAQARIPGPEQEDTYLMRGKGLGAIGNSLHVMQVMNE